MKNYFCIKKLIARTYLWKFDETIEKNIFKNAPVYLMCVFRYL